MIKVDGVRLYSPRLLWICLCHEVGRHSRELLEPAAHDSVTIREPLVVVVVDGLHVVHARIEHVVEAVLWFVVQVVGHLRLRNNRDYISYLFQERAYVFVECLLSLLGASATSLLFSGVT